MRCSATFAILACVWSILGCGKTTPGPSTPKEPVSVTEASRPTDRPARFVHVQVMSRDKTGSCTVTFTPLPVVPGREIKHGSTCGHPGTITKLSWQYLGTTDAGDRYAFERTFPLDEPKQTTAKREILYAGKELVVFDDDESTVVIQPTGEADLAAEGVKPRHDT